MTKANDGNMTLALGWYISTIAIIGPMIGIYVASMGRLGYQKIDRVSTL